MKTKLKKVLAASLVAAALVACNGTSSQTATTPQPMPSSTWVNTNLSAYLSTNGLTSKYSYYVATTDGLYLSTKKTSDNTEHVLFYSNTNQTWSDVTGSLGITLTAGATELFIATNGNGLIYTTTSNKLYTMTTNNNTWSQVVLPDSYLVASVAVEEQTRKLAILGYKVTTALTLQPFELESDNSITTLGAAENMPSGATTFYFSVSPNGTQYSIRYVTASDNQVSINGSLYSEKIPSTSYTSPTISNAGYLYLYPSYNLNNPANNRPIYQCVNGSCETIQSSNSLLNAAESTFIRSVSASSKIAGTFFINVETQSTATTTTNTNYICNSTTCTIQGNQLSIAKSNESFTANYTLYSNNIYSTTPSSSAFGYLSGFYWLSDGAWSNLAPSLNDGQESATTVYDEVYQVCSYTPTTSLIRYLSNDGESEIIYTNTSNNTWQNISQTPTQSTGTFMDYGRLTTAVNPNNGASTFGGMINLEKNEADNTLNNISIYPQNIVCPTLY